MRTVFFRLIRVSFDYNAFFSPHHGTYTHLNFQRRRGTPGANPVRGRVPGKGRARARVQGAARLRREVRDLVQVDMEMERRVFGTIKVNRAVDQIDVTRESLAVHARSPMNRLRWDVVHGHMAPLSDLYADA